MAILDDMRGSWIIQLRIYISWIHSTYELRIEGNMRSKILNVDQGLSLVFCNTKIDSSISMKITCKQKKNEEMK